MDRKVLLVLYNRIGDGGILSQKKNGNKEGAEDIFRKIKNIMREEEERWKDGWGKTKWNHLN